MCKWNAEDYHKSSSAQQKWARELIQKLNLKGNESVLDVGCGDGKITAEIAECLPGGSIVGIDNSAEMIRFAAKKFPPNKFPNLSFKKIDAVNLPFEGEFDVVFSNACLHWIVDHMPVLVGIKKSLKPKGKILIQMGGKGNAAGIFEILEMLLKSEKWSKYFEKFSFPYGFYGIEEYKNWLKEAGFKIIRVDLISKDMTQLGKEGLAAWLRTTWFPYIEKVPAGLRESFVNELTDKYIEINPLDENGLVHVQMIRLEVEARGMNKRNFKFIFAPAGVALGIFIIIGIMTLSCDKLRINSVWEILPFIPIQLIRILGAVLIVLCNAPR